MSALISTPLDTLTAIEARRSVKAYDPEFKMPDADLRKLMELALLSPTSFNIQNWRIVAVTDPAIKEQLKAAAWNQAQVSDAAVTLIFCADLKAHARNPERYWKNAPEAVQNMLVPMIGKFYEGNEQLQRDEAIRSIGIAAQTTMLAAKAMGYDSCPMIGFDPVTVGEIINLPEDHIIGMMLPVGKALQPARERGGQLAYDDVVHITGF